MAIADFLRAVFALALTLGLIGLVAVGLRRLGPEWMARLQNIKKDRRLAIVESLPLDPNRRLVLVSLDGVERLILLGEGRLLESATATRRPAARSKSDG